MNAQLQRTEVCGACFAGNHACHQFDYINRHGRVVVCKCIKCLYKKPLGAVVTKPDTTKALPSRKPGPKGPRKPGVTVAPPEPRETWDVTVRVTVPPAITRTRAGDASSQAVMERLIGERCSLQPCIVIGVRAERLLTQLPY